ncbi:MAG: YibE/F family protein, partial [Oscillospiraceae bacterium]|nr:YibE/F family protein [Oscillospiraceae bacterium]
MKIFKNTVFQQAVTVALSILLLVIAGLFCNYKPEIATDSELQHAVVNEVIATTQEPSVNNKEAKVVIFSATIKTGEHKGESFKMTQLLDEMSPPVPKPVEKGDKILVAYTQSEHHGTSAISGWTYAGTNNLPGVILLVGGFLILILIIGRGKGVSTIVSLVITIAAVMYIYIPALLLGYNIYLVTILTTLFVIISSLCILNGWNKKTLCSVVGNAGG